MLKDLLTLLFIIALFILLCFALLDKRPVVADNTNFTKELQGTVHSKPVDLHAKSTSEPNCETHLKPNDFILECH